MSSAAPVAVARAMLQAAIARGESAGEPVAAVAVASARRERKVEVPRFVDAAAKAQQRMA